MAIRMTGLVSGLDTDSIVQELVSAYSSKKEKYEKEQTKLEWKQEIWSDLNKEVNSLYKSVGNLRYSSGYTTKKTTSSDSTKATVTADSSAVVGTQKLHILSTAQSGYLTGGKLTASGSNATSSTTVAQLGFSGSSSLQFTAKDADGNDISAQISIESTDTVNDVVSKLKEAGLNASYDSTNGRLYLSSSDSGAATDFSISAITKTETTTDEEGNEITTTTTDEDSLALLNALGLNTADDATNKATKIDGTDAIIVLNGVQYTSSTNNFSINGLTISVTAATESLTDENSTTDEDGNIVVDTSKLDDSKAVTLTTATDAQAIYDKIKDFLTSYNNIINEMTKLYNADSASDYEPLTDDEKDAMSDTEIEKWETKIKDSLLRRDSNLSTIMNAMETAMTKSVTVNGKSYVLSSFGISTLGYLNAAENEQNAYHIDGDEDDENTSGNTDKLLAAINEDPDTVVSFMQQLAKNLYSAIDDQMQSTTLRSRYSIYNDKEMESQYDDYTDLIEDWEDKISDKEDYYYDKFSAMETALSELNSSTSSISSMLG